MDNDDKQFRFDVNKFNININSLIYLKNVVLNNYQEST